MHLSADIERALQGVSSAALRAPLRACAIGSLAPNVGLMQLCLAAATEQEAKRALTGVIADLEARTSAAAERLRQALGLWSQFPDAFVTVKAIMATECLAPVETPEHRVAQIATTFDRAVEVSPEASVALYSLGSPELLKHASSELIERLHGWGLLAPSAVVLDLGCGIGRLLEGLAPQVRFVLGVEISSNMMLVARRRCAGWPNVGLIRTSGCDLAAIADESVDVVCAFDTFPYIVRLGPELVIGHISDARRILKPGGSLVILNFSYRGDITRDRAEVADLAEHCGLKVLRNGTPEFTLWDGIAFHLLRTPEVRPGVGGPF
jgi:ubiquinone/menaquinone biosynthesis C-methylase UbiE